MTAVDVASEQLIRVAHPGGAPGRRLRRRGGRRHRGHVRRPAGSPTRSTARSTSSTASRSSRSRSRPSATGGVVAGSCTTRRRARLFTAVRGGGACWTASRSRCPRRTDARQTLVGTGYHYRADVRAHQAAELARLLPADPRRPAAGLGRARPLLRRLRTARRLRRTRTRALGPGGGAACRRGGRRPGRGARTATSRPSC